MAITSATLIENVVLYVRGRLRANITDPISGSRTGDFVMTSYPKEATQYPIITIKTSNISDESLGQQSEQRKVNFKIEVRVWARNEKEKDELSSDVYSYLRTNQFPSSTANTSSNIQLHDFGLDSAVEVDESGEEGIKSRIFTYRYMFIAA